MRACDAHPLHPRDPVFLADLSRDKSAMNPKSTAPQDPSNLPLSRAGFGCAALAGMYRPCPEDQAQAALQAAWDGGVRHFDTAPFYGTGLSEQRLGQFLMARPRGSYTLSTKVGRMLTSVPAGEAPFYGFHSALPARVHFDYSGPAILASFTTSLARLGVETIDLLLIHDIGTLAHAPDEARRHWYDLLATGLPMLQRLKAEGRIRAWGLGVNEVQVCLDLMERAMPDAILMANRFTLLDQSARPVLDRLHASGGAAIIGGVFNSGILATGPVPGATYDYVPAPEPILDRVRRLDADCARYGTSRIAAALQFPFTHPAVAQVLVSAADPELVTRNLNALCEPEDPRVFPVPV